MIIRKLSLIGLAAITLLSSSCVETDIQMGSQSNKTLATSGGATLDLPTPPRPEHQALVARFENDYATVMKEGAQFFQPTTMAEWPCKISQSTLLEAANLQLADPKEAEKANKKIRKSLRDQGIDPGKGSYLLPEYTNVRISPIQATCKGGKIDGVVELLAEYETKYNKDTVMQLQGKAVTMTTKSDTKNANRMWVRFDAGKVAMPIIIPKSIKQTFSNVESSYDDKAFNEMIAKNAIPQSKDPSIEIFYDMGSQGFWGGFTVKMKPKVLSAKNIILEQNLTSLFFAPEPDGRQQTDNYDGKKWTLMILGKHTKDGQKHGEQITRIPNQIIGGKSLAEYPDYQSQGARVITVDGKEVIETRTCFSHGQEIKTANCPKD